MLKLALQARLPFIHVTTDDILNVGAILSHIAELPEIKMAILPKEIKDVSSLDKMTAQIYYTCSETDNLTKLYRYLESKNMTMVFVNTEKSVLHFDCGVLVPPKEMVIDKLLEFVDEDTANEILPSFGGMTLKDTVELSKLTMTRDSQMTVRGVNSTRRSYISKLKGIQQIDTSTDYYLCPTYLQSWLELNEKFFLNDYHASLTPRGLLFDGPPGTGKTMAAKYIADTFGIPLYHLDLGAMMGKYVGDSEGNLLAALQQIDQVEPCVVLFDEVEKVFQASSDSGVTSRLLSQMLWWLQEHKTKVFSVMTTNDVSKIPPELYREGRIDKTMTFLGLESENEGRQFAKSVMDALAKAMGAELEKEHYALLDSRVKVMFTDVAAVAQGKVTQAVRDLLRELI